MTLEADSAMTRPPFATTDADRLLNRGHPAGDFLEAYEWLVVDEEVDRIEVACHLPDHVLNPRRELFGGFTGAYVDLIALFTVRAGPDRLDVTKPRGWLSTTNMRIDYLAAVTGPIFRIQSQVEHRGGRSRLVRTQFYQDDRLAVTALTSLLQLPDQTNTSI